ncbi:MAG TPA: carboxypeptidase-like regulatory domain-containing protein [Terriglobales bacterium]|nr:carboxypeptidase-like regulatory domain-containing protein [Terriglobales bacterium]
MLGAQPFLCRSVAFAAFLLLLEPIAARQNSPQGSSLQANAGSDSSTLRICLRLEDESTFSGPATVRLVTNEGRELGGRMESEGEMVFPDLPPGPYTLEATSPGFVAVHENVDIGADNRLQTRYVIMRPMTLDVQTPEPTLAPPPESIPELSTWKPPDIDEAVPPVNRSVECPLLHILSRTGLRMKEFVTDLEKFSAAERVEHSVVDVTGARHDPTVRDFNYVVTISRTANGVFLLDEYRNGSVDPEQFPAHIATQGMPAIALLFHPLMAPDFNFKCEGLGEWEGKSSWQVHFVQRPDRPGKLLAYSAGGRYSSLPLKGRAWIDPGSFQVRRLETELVHPLKEMGLTEEHIVITYQPVRFRTQEQQLWLPHVVELYVERQGRRYYRRHTLTDFQLFTVDTIQNIQLAKESYGFTNESDHEIKGVLTVNPIPGTKFKSVSVSFTIPARGNVVKLVGPGKDIGIPVQSVASATFAHDGPHDSVKVDAHLSKESTLDVISNPSGTLKP